MLRDAAVSRVLLGCGNRSGANLEAAVRDYFLDIQDELEQEPELPWFLRTEITSSETVPDEERVAPPTDFLAEWEDDALWFFDTAPEPGFPQWRALQKAEMDGIRQDAYKLYTSSGDDPANPTTIVKPMAYAFDGRYFRISPVPDKIYQLRMIYFKKDQTLATNIENLWLKYAHDIFIGAAGQRLGEDLGISDRRMLRFGQMETRGRQRTYAKTVELQTTNRQIIMGGADN